MKKCSRCGEVKDLISYYKCCKNLDGLMGYCKVCHNKNIKGSNKVLYVDIKVGDTYKNTLGEDFTVTAITGDTAYIHFNELIHGSISLKLISKGKVYRNARSGDIRVKLSSGQRVGNLTILDGGLKRNAKMSAKCDCGNEIKVNASSLLRGVKSCGCMISSSSMTKVNFNKAMETWNPATHRSDVKKLPIFSLNPNGEGCNVSSWTYVDNYTYNYLSKCMITKSGYVLISLSKLNCEALGVKYDYSYKSIPLHCWVKAMPSGIRHIVTDHANGNKLDNRLSNLRIATHYQNTANRKSSAVSGYRGVKFKTDKFRNFPWVASQSKILTCGKQEDYSLGYYATAEEAAYQVDLFNIKRYGEFTRLNLKRKIYEDLGILPVTPKKYKLP